MGVLKRTLMIKVKRALILGKIKTAGASCGSIFDGGGVL
jgi:hypothetical protein